MATQPPSTRTPLFWTLMAGLHLLILYGLYLIVTTVTEILGYFRAAGNINNLSPFEQQVVITKVITLTVILFLVRLAWEISRLLYRRWKRRQEHQSGKATGISNKRP